jgi:hypothetical protein
MGEAMLGFAAIGMALGILAGVPFWRWIYANKGAKYGLMLALLIFLLTIWPIFLVQDFTYDDGTPNFHEFFATERAFSAMETQRSIFEKSKP